MSALPAGTPRARIERVVVKASGADPIQGRRLAARLPAMLEQTLRNSDAGTDPRALRALVERAVREAAR